MQTQTQLQTNTEQVSPLASEVESPHTWNSATKIVFRFAFVYAALYLTYYKPFLGDFLTLPGDRMWDPVVRFVAKYILRLGDIPFTRETGSGDTTVSYVLAFTFL